MLDTQLKNKNIKTITNLEDITIFGFENEFLQVIINIINNSKDEFEKKEIENRYIFIDIIVPTGKNPILAAQPVGIQNHCFGNFAVKINFAHFILKPFVGL